MKKTEQKIWLEECGDKHEKGNVCYLRFQKAEVSHTEERYDCMVDYDEQGNVLGIEFYDGLKIKKVK